MLTPSAMRQVVSAMVTEHRLSITRACLATGLSRVAYYKVPPLPQDKDTEVIDALNGRWGFWKCFDRLPLGPAVEPQTGLAGVLRSGPWTSCTTCSTTAGASEPST
jgi:hypothetical protein